MKPTNSNKTEQQDACTQTPLRFYSLDLTFRLLVVYLYGYFVCEFMLHFLQEHGMMAFKSRNFPVSLFPLVSGFSALLMGSVYPLLDIWFHGKPLKKGWYLVSRCCGGFLGVNYAVAKLHWMHSAKLTVALGIIAIGLWFLFDRTLYGFLLAAVTAAIGTCFVSLLVRSGVYSFSLSTNFGTPPWLPCILHSASILAGSIGRQLDLFHPRMAKLLGKARVSSISQKRD